MSNRGAIRPGLIAGPLQLEDERGRHDLCDGEWTSDQTSPQSVRFVSSTAKYILLIEKGSTYNKIRASDFAERNDCILIYGRGFPSRTFRRLVHRLHAQLRLPFYVFADNDPAGYELFFLMARGSTRSAGRPRPEFAILDAKFLGIRVGERSDFGIAADYGIDLTPKELEHLRRLRRCSWLRGDGPWQRELRDLETRGFKIEMEAIQWVEPGYIDQRYLPERLGADDLLRLRSARSRR